MKILVLEGSPHKKGSSNLLAEQFIQGAKEAGHTMEIIDVAHLSMHPCLGCDACGMDGPCVQKDDNQRIRNALLTCDMAVFVTPLYYFGFSAQMKMVIDRFYSYTYRLTHRHLKTALIVAAYDREEDTMHSLVTHYRKLCDYMTFQDQGMVLGYGCGTPSMTAHSVSMQEAYELGRSL